MTNRTERSISPEQLSRAGNNYIRCLNLPKSSQVLIITDKLPEDLKGESDPNLLIRRSMAQKLEEELHKKGHAVTKVEYTGAMDFDSFHKETERVLQELDQLDGTRDANSTTTVVYLGDVYLNRRGIYKAASDFGAKRKVRVAGSLGFTTGDCRVMSEMDSRKLKIIEENNKYFEDFFKERPQGMFDVLTLGEDKRQHSLHLSYDTERAPFETDMGRFEEKHRVILDNFQYVNIPGGEKFGAPYPLDHINGEFAAEGLLFKVSKGMVVNVDFMGSRSLDSFDPSQQKLIELVQNGRPIPVAELGLGFYELAGIKTYPDSSILSREKGGPHFGLGHNVSPNEEESRVSELAGDFHHTDFVLEQPVLIWANPEAREHKQFYPPQK